MNVRDEAMKELMKGQEFAKQLGQVVLEVMKNNKNMNHLGATQQLVSKVVNSFTNTLFLLNKHHQRKEEEDFSFIIKSEEDSQDSCKTTTSAGGGGGGGRGSNKRRKTTETYEEVSERPTDDGHEWRKYGQKTILNSKYSRDYYRCTHKIDQRCQATKQVQRIEEKPPLYKTTYYGHHTCNKNNIIFEPTSPHDPSSILLSFNNTFPTPTKQDCPFLSIPSSSSSSSFNSSPSLDEYLLSPEPILDNSISTTHVNVSSTLSSTTTLQSDDHKDMMIMYGLLYDSVELDHDFLHPFHGFQL